MVDVVCLLVFVCFSCASYVMDFVFVFFMLIHGYNAYLWYTMFKKKVGEEEAGVVEEGVGDAVVEDEEEGGRGRS